MRSRRQILRFRKSNARQRRSFSSDELVEFDARSIPACESRRPRNAECVKRNRHAIEEKMQKDLVARPVSPTCSVSSREVPELRKKAEGQRLAVALWSVWAGAPASYWMCDSRPSKSRWATAAHGRVFSTRVRAVVHGDVALHSHVRLSTRGTASAFGSRQGDERA